MIIEVNCQIATTTNLGMLDRLVADYSADLVLVDAVPSQKLIGRVECLRALNPKLPIILLYVYNSRETALDRAIREHVDSVFYKPLEIAPISRRIEELLTSPS